MIASLDASVVLRIILQQPQTLPEWDDIELGVSSALLATECRRTFDQLWHRGELNESDIVLKHGALQVLLPRLDIRSLDQTVLELASQPLPTNLATLDALHLATAIIYRRSQPDDERPIVFATHDRALAKAATEMNFEVIGAPG